MAGAENVNHAVGEDGFGEPIGGFADRGLLGSDGVNETAAVGEVFGGGGVVHKVVGLRSTRHRDTGSRQTSKPEFQIPKKFQTSSKGIQRF
jgi:hypothetical protein